MPGFTASRSFDNTTINANAAFEAAKMSSDMSGSWKYLVDSLGGGIQQLHRQGRMGVRTGVRSNGG